MLPARFTYLEMVHSVPDGVRNFWPHRSSTTETARTLGPSQSQSTSSSARGTPALQPPRSGSQRTRQTRAKHFTDVLSVAQEAG